MLKLFINLILFLLTLIASVIAQAEQGVGSTLPLWITAPPKDTLSAMWGIGAGNDLESAKRYALKDIAAKLSVAISAHLESRITVSSNSIDRYAHTLVTEDVQRTEFKNYSLEKSMQIGQDFYVLIRVNRRELIANEEQKLTMAEKEISLGLTGNKNENAIEKFVAQRKTLPWLEQAVSAALILSAADTSFDDGRLRKHQAALAKAKNAAGGLSFDIKAIGNSRDVVQTVINFLNESGMRSGAGGTPLIIETIATLDSVFDSFTVQLQINFNILDKQGRNLASNEFKVQGASMKDHRSARQAALQDLGEKLREEGPLAALGFN